MRGFEAYAGMLANLLALPDEEYLSRAEDVTSALTDGPSLALRRLIHKEARQSAGVFFSSPSLAGELVERCRDSWTGSSVVLDPACGAGDLSVPAAIALAPVVAGELDAHIVGRDLHEHFVDTTRLRLLLAARSGQLGSKHAVAAVSPAKRYPALAVGSGLGSDLCFNSATHILLNPPYHPTVAPPGCGWASGRITSAALFLLHALNRAQQGAHVHALLPDSLRSGDRYRRWRQAVDSVADVHDITPLGRFDPYTDVDVFALSAVVASKGSDRHGRTWTPVPSASTIDRAFEISVGSVVNYRDPLLGPNCAYAVARDLPAWSTVDMITKRRPFNGRLHTPPFVLVRRTSSPSERFRARATVVLGPEAVAVDNHLLVMAPRDGSVDTCLEALKVLQSEKTNEWLNQRIRCRHVTVDALAKVPWSAA